MATSIASSSSDEIERLQYAYPAHVHASDFLSVKLSGVTNYDPWKEQMFCLLGSYDMLGFIEKIPDSSEKKNKEWKRSDALVKGWIYGSLCEDVMGTVILKLNPSKNIVTSKKVWDELGKTYGTPQAEFTTSNKGWKEQLPLLEAIMTGKWEKVRDIEHASTVRLNDDEDTPLHVAISTCRNFQVVQNLLDEMDLDLLPTLRNKDGMHPLHRAALVGNLDAAKMLVKKNPSLLFIPDKRNFLPIHRAIFDTACELIEKYPGMARATEKENSIPLKMIAGRSNAYFSATQYNFYQKFVYDHVPLQNDNLYNAGKKFDVENQGKGAATSVANGRRSFFHSVPHVKQLQEGKQKHNKALKVLKYICKEVGKTDNDNVIRKHYTEAVIHALEHDNSEAIEEVVRSFPRAIWTKHNGYGLTQSAVINRCKNVYSYLVHGEIGDKHTHKICTDNDGNNLLHLAGKLAPIDKLNQISGAALQMQREIQWFEEVKKFALPRHSKTKNKKKETPMMVFRREHEQLRKDGEEWMKKTADSYTVTAALIITIVFAAAITVPGGNDGNSGKAIYARKTSFIIFAISDSISLFTSTTSLLLFLSILTARYREEDFLKRLPERLILGLAMLFVSVTSMMVAFSATFVGVYKNGHVEIVANDRGNGITPSWVAFTDSDRLIAEAAKDQAAVNAERTIFNVKRLNGRKFESFNMIWCTY
ncbi:putative ankyrin repeat-containing domain, PGG domain, retrotransposon copia-like protein [Tanacetum coccineum]